MPAAARGAKGKAQGKAKAPRGKAKAQGKGTRAPAARGAQPLEQRILVTATLCLLAFGAVMVYSSSSASTLLQGQGNGSSYLIKFVIFGALGLALMRVLARDGVAKVQGVVAPMLAVSFALVLAVHIPHVGIAINGARRWIGPSIFQFEPSELLKISLVLYAATLLARKPHRVHDLHALAKPLLIVVGAACLLVVTEPDLGSAMVIAFTISALLLAAGIPTRNFAILAGSTFLLVALYAIARPYARARLTSFVDPWAHASGSGFQAVQGQIAIGSGGLFGVGPGQSVQKIFYLPEAQTDFILAVIAEELGVLGVSALLFLYGLIAYAGLRTAKRARSLYSALIAVGMTTLIVSQALLNAFAVLGLAPLTGVPLPFVSYGSSSLVVMLGAMGLLMNVASGTSAHVRVVGDTGARKPAGLANGRRGSERSERESDRASDDRGRRDRRARRAGARGR
jgi:cell division protein FtsW